LVIANRFAIKYLASQARFQAKRCGDPPEKKKADRHASLAMTNKCAQDDKSLVIANRFASKYSANQARFRAKRCGNPPD